MSTSARRVLGRLAVLLALLGLLWMHGLGTHGILSPAPAPAPAPAAAQAGHAAPAAEHGPAAAGQHDGGGHGAHLVAGMCLALVLAAVVLLLARRTGLLLRLRTTGHGLLPGLARLAPRARPPDLVALGVCRC